ncbi:MAG TPA: FkbM family methyltransferase [Puia sp.]|jgi:FkbM family methyltransferase|nr:FkbM family methyltransferase [Puia sp.]
MDALLRRLPVFKGKQRLARLLYGNSIASKKDFWVKGKQNCEYLLPNLVENIGFEIFINGIFEKETSDFFASVLPANGVFLDLGANIGTITVPLIKKRQDIKIVCVEAAPWIFNYLEKNLARNHARNVTAINKVLFYTDNEEVNFYSPGDKFGKGSLSPVFTDKLVKVKTIKVDSLVQEMEIPKVDIIKIDVEGYEYHVFKGAVDLLSKADAPDIVFEFVDWAEGNAKGIQVGDAQQILLDLGYRIYHFNNKLKHMKQLPGVIKQGFFMLFASKKYKTRE